MTSCVICRRSNSATFASSNLTRARVRWNSLKASSIPSLIGTETSVNMVVGAARKLSLANKKEAVHPAQLYLRVIENYFNNGEGFMDNLGIRWGVAVPHDDHLGESEQV